MTKDELKKQLHQYRDLKAEYKQITEELERVEAIMTAPRPANLDGMPRSPGAGDPILAAVSQHLMLAERYRAKLQELAAAQALVEDMIEGLEPMERQLMRCRYIDGLTWEEVCVAIGYSWSRTHDIHGGILNKLMEKSGEEVTA